MIGALATVSGAALVVRPLASLSALLVVVVISAVLLALGELARVGAPRRLGRLARFRAAGWLVVAIAVAAWPGLGVAGIAVVVGIALVADGATHLAGARRAVGPARVEALTAGLAAVLLGVLALTWPDVSVLVVAVVFGARVSWFGLTLLTARADRGAAGGGAPAPEPDATAPADAATGRGGTWRMLRAVAALVVVTVLVGVSALLSRSAPALDGFADPPATIPAEPGRLLRTEPFTGTVPEGAAAWRILYTTTAQDGAAALATGLVLTSTDPPVGPRPVVAWAHGTTGVAEVCAPSLLDDPFTAGATPGLAEVVARDWVVVATDYAGLGTPGPHPYLIGTGEAHSVLDAVRAARELSALDPAAPVLEDRTVVWGHSQGGHAALWTGQLADSYAPEVGVVGVAALAPAADLPALAAGLGELTGGPVFASVMGSALRLMGVAPDAPQTLNVKAAAEGQAG